jgi:alkylhydroperoxidase family enzyme
MAYFLPTVEPEKADGQVKRAYDTLTEMFQTVPKVFVAQSIRPDLLELIVNYVNKLMIETHSLPRQTKELIAAHVSRINSCAY